MSSLWNLGFRPFLLFGIFWTVIHLAHWIAFQAGWISFTPAADPVAWHAHELVYGYVMAIVAGFLLTATQNWTGIPGVKGLRLRAIVAVWGLARILSCFWREAPLLFALADLAFLPILAVGLWPYLGQPSQGKNRVFLLLFLALFAFNLLSHLAVNGFVSFPTRSSMYGAIYVVLLMVSLIAGRVIPFFAGAVIPDLKAGAPGWLEALAAVSLVLFFAASLFLELSPFVAVLAFVAAAAQLARWLLWRPWRATGIPVLFVLYVAYFWLPLGLVLKGLSSFGFLPPSAALHAFTAGCIGSMIYGMITRVALGHSGRPIRPVPVIVLGYVLITLSAAVRVIWPVVEPGTAVTGFAASGSLWILAHVIFLVVYAPILWSPRADGRPG